MPPDPPSSSPSDPSLPHGDAEERRLIALAQTHGLETPAGRQACGELLTRAQGRLFAACFRMLGSRQEAEELTQEAMVKIIKGLDTYDGRRGGGVNTWMTRIAMNACLTYLRKQKLRKHVSLEALTGGTGAIPKHKPRPQGNRLSLSPDSSASAGGEGRGEGGNPAGRELGPDERVELHERSVLVSAALGRVSPEHRAMLVLRDIQGLEYEQIADVLDMNVGTVKSRLFRARAALRQVIEHMEHGAGEGGGSTRHDA